MKKLNGLKRNWNYRKPREQKFLYTNSDFLFVEEEAMLGRFQTKLSITKER
jgi:hypothetical protein